MLLCTKYPPKLKILTGKGTRKRVIIRRRLARIKSRRVKSSKFPREREIPMATGMGIKVITRGRLARVKLRSVKFRECLCESAGGYTIQLNNVHLMLNKYFFVKIFISKEISSYILNR